MLALLPLLISVLVLILIIVVFPCNGYSDGNIAFSRPFNCAQNENKFEPCIIGLHPKGVQVMLLGSHSPPCKTQTGNQFKYFYEPNGNDIPSTRISPNFCRGLSHDIAVVGNIEVKYEVLPITPYHESNISSNIDDRIRKRRIFKPSYKGDPYLPDPTIKPKIYKYPFPSLQILMAKYEIAKRVGQTVFVFPDKEIVLKEVCTDGMRAFKLNNRYFLFVDYLGCDSGIAGISIYEVKCSEIKRVYDDASFSM